MERRDAFGQAEAATLGGAGAPAGAGRATDTRLERELAPGEQVLWSEKPDSRRWFYPEDLVLVPFSLLWGGFAIFWEASALTASPPHEDGAALVVSALWGIPFVALGLYLMVGRLFARRWIRRGSLYALTDRRVVSFSPSLTGEGRVKMIWLRSSPPLEKRPGRDGRGTLCVGELASGQRWLGAGGGWPRAGAARTSAIVFSDISDAAAVYSRIARQIAAASEPAVHS